MGRDYAQSTLDRMGDDERRRRHLKVRSPKKRERVYDPQYGHGSRNYLCITVHIDPETHAEVVAHANKHGQLRSQALRDLIEWGLLEAKAKT